MQRDSEGEVGGFAGDAIEITAPINLVNEESNNNSIAIHVAMFFLHRVGASTPLQAS